MKKNLVAPALFISHGAPTFALEPGLLGASLRSLGQSLSDLRAVLVVSPHWQTREVVVMTTPEPETVHDFGGFPAELYRLQYPVRGEPILAKEAAALLENAGFKTSLDERRGLDHGSWVVLYHLLPQSNIPVFQVSMPYTLTAAEALKMGQALAPLRQQGVAIVGSGSMTHNLHDIRQPGTRPETYVEEFSSWVGTAVQAHALTLLQNYRTQAPHAEQAHPTEEHFLPLLVSIGATKDEETLQVLPSEVTYGVLSMASYGWGLPQEGLAHQATLTGD